MDCSTPGFPVHHQLTKLAQTHVHQVSDAIQPSHPLSSLLLLPSIFPSIRVFSNESLLCIRWPKYWSFSFSISPSNEYSGLIFFRMDWLDLFAVQRTLKSLLQHHRSKPSILQHSPFFIVQISHPYMTFTMLREIDGETVETVSDFIFWGSKITADGDCSHEIKRCLLLGGKAMTSLDSILKSFTNKGPSSQGYDFSSSHVWM